MFVNVALLIVAGAAVAMVVLSFLRWIYSKQLERIIDKRVEKILNKQKDNNGKRNEEIYRSP